MGGADHDLEVKTSRGPGAASEKKIGDFRMKGDENDEAYLAEAPSTIVIRCPGIFIPIVIHQGLRLR